MGTLYLVRHGQASFGAADYDQLSPRGREQGERLGRYWRERGQTFEAVITGTLRRHAQTWEAIAEAARYEHSPLALPGLNEYDSAALITAIHPEPLAKPDTPEKYREHFRLLRQALQRWMQGEITPQGMPTFADFVAGVRGALDLVREQYRGDVLIVSSGGPISTAVAQVLNAPFETAIELNLRIRNSALTAFDYNPKRHALLSFNTLPHLDAPQDAPWVTYA